MAVAVPEGRLGVGSGPIYLNNVYCTGNESKLLDCKHYTFLYEYCEHSYDAGVICMNENKNCANNSTGEHLQYFVD